MPSKILVVDDNRSLVEILKMDFELRGHKVFTAYDGEEAEQSIRENHPELVILDVMMPKKNGYAVCRDIKRDFELSKIPIVLLTAKNTKDDIYWGYDCGADAYVTKPYESRDLIRLVEQLLQDAKEGKRSYAWTGLPDASVVEKEISLRKDAGGDVVVLNIEFDDEAKEGFIQKYGMGIYRDMIHSLAWKIYNTIQEISPTTMVGQYGDDSFILLTHPDEKEKIKERIIEEGNSLIKGYYSEEDKIRGGISVIDIRSGKETIVSMISLLVK